MLLEPARRDGRWYLNPVPTKVGVVSVMLKMGPRFFLGSKARSPRGPLGPFHTDARIYNTRPRSRLRITWIGHATSYCRRVSVVEPEVVSPGSGSSTGGGGFKGLLCPTPSRGLSPTRESNLGVF